MDAREQFQAHVDLCSQCRNNPFGFCSRGYALLGRAARMRDEREQGELSLMPREVVERPLARMAWQQAGRA